MLDLGTVCDWQRMNMSSRGLMTMNRWMVFWRARDTDVLALIEDEILLSLPISPRHDECECSIGGHGRQGYSRRETAFCRAGGTEKTALTFI